MLTHVSLSWFADPKVTEEEFNNFKFWVQYAAAAYCNYDKQPGDLVTCGNDECDDVQANNATIVSSVVFVSSRRPGRRLCRGLNKTLC